MKFCHSQCPGRTKFHKSRRASPPKKHWTAIQKHRDIEAVSTENAEQHLCWRTTLVWDQNRYKAGHETVQARSDEPHKQQGSSWDWLTKASNLLLLQGRSSHCQACQNPHPSRSLHKLLAVAKVLETALAKCLSHKLYPHRQLPMWNIHVKTAHGTGSGRLNQSFKEFIEQNWSLQP